LKREILVSLFIMYPMCRHGAFSRGRNLFIFEQRCPFHVHMWDARGEERNTDL